MVSLPRYADELPPAVRYVYPQVTIDLGSCLAIHCDGQQRPLLGQTYWLLVLLLERPGRVISYVQLARTLMPAFSARQGPRARSLDAQQRESLTRAMHALAYRTRLALGEQGSTPSILINRGTIGYAIRHPLRVIAGDVPDGQPHLPGAAPSAGAHLLAPAE
jgi:hypothetical protein